MEHSSNQLKMEGKFKLQNDRSTAIADIAAKCDDEETFAQLSRHAITTRYDLLITTWDKFVATHEKLAESEADGVFANEYYKSDIYACTLRLYIKAKSALLDRLSPPTPTAHAHPVDVNLTQLSSTQTRQRLPEITLPTFSGEYEQWRPYRDLFKSMVIDNPALSQVEKMHYLKRSLTDDAAELISTVPVTEDSFEGAWLTLTTRYDNTRMLVRNRLNALLIPKPLNCRSPKELGGFLATINEALNSLKALGAPVHEWDWILVHFLQKQLHVRTREAFELSLGNSTDPATYAQLEKFLLTRQRAMESITRKFRTLENKGETQYFFPEF